MTRLNPTVLGLLTAVVAALAFLSSVCELFSYQQCILDRIENAASSVEPTQINLELTRAEKATNQLINSATFGVPTRLIQFRNLLKGLKDQMSKANNMSDRTVLEIRTEILGLPNPRFMFLIVEFFSIKWLLVAVLIAITIVLELQEDRQRSTSGRI